jgi:hypothetical protein
MAEPRRRRRWKLLLLVLLAALALAGGAAFSQRQALRTWYYAYKLERAPEAERQAWADRLVEVGEPAVPRLLACLRRDDPHLCAVARGAIEKLLASWPPKDPRAVKLAEQLFEAQPSFAPAGQVAALQLLPDLLDAGGVETAAKARPLVAAALKEKSAEQRFLAAGLASRSELNLLPAVQALLEDPEPEVRRAAMLVLGPIREGKGGAEKPLVGDNELLRWLHDPDPEVRRLCEMSLRSRGRSERDIRLGRLVTAPAATERLKLLLELPDEDEINDLAVWLRRLSNDPDAAVRAGAARVAAERNVDFAERLEQMTHADPDATVRKIAEHYRKRYP